MVSVVMNTYWARTTSSTPATRNADGLTEVSAALRCGDSVSRGHGGAFGGLPEPRAALDAEGAAIGGPPPTLRAEGIHVGVLRP